MYSWDHSGWSDGLETEEPIWVVIEGGGEGSLQLGNIGGKYLEVNLYCHANFS